MKYIKSMFKHAFTVALMAMTSALRVCAATTWTDYFGGAVPTSGTVTIAADDEVVINDPEMAASAQCTVNVAAGATLLLDTSTPPTFSFGTKCYGKVEKVYSGNWQVATKNQSNFKGTYVVSSGEVVINGTYYKIFGSVEALDTGTLYVTNGATLSYSGASSRLGSIPIHLGGTLSFSSSTFNSSVFDFLTLAGDATITMPGSASAFVDRFNEDNPSFIDLNGHALTFGGTGKLTLKNGSIKGAGDITVGAGTSAKKHMLHLKNYTVEAGGEGDVIEMKNYSGLSTDTPLTLFRKVKVGNADVKFPGPAWTTFAGGLDGDVAVVSAFVTNAVADGMVSFYGRTIVNDTLSVGNYSTPDNGALWIGHCATGGLGVAEGSIVSNKLMVGGTSDTKKYQIGCGAVRQTGGEVCIIGSSGTSALRNTSTIGWSAHGYYELTSGVTRVAGNFVVGMASPGILAQYGGLFEQVPHPNSPATSPMVHFSLSANDRDANAIPSVVYVGGGTMKLGQMLLCHGNDSESIVTVTGESSLLETPARIYFGYDDGTAALVNLNDGGTLATPYFAFAQNVDAKLYVNFDGGILKIMPFVAGASELTNIFGIPNGSVPQTTRVTVGPHGATIDTAGRNMSADVSFSAPEGKIVSAIPFDAETGWTVAPYVKIVDDEGEGAGATAFADFDSATGTLKGFRVTSGGWNYVSAKAQVFVCKTKVREIACTLADAPAAGAFRKTGAGTLTLTAANSWAGDTIIESGTLRAGCVGAFPSGSRVVMAGGKVEVSSGVDFPAELTIDMELDENETYVLSDNFSGDSPPSLVGAPDDWMLVASRRKLLLKHRRGFTLIVR